MQKEEGGKTKVCLTLRTGQTEMRKAQSAMTGTTAEVSHASGELVSWKEQWSRWTWEQ